MYEDIEGQARAMRERAAENLRLVDGANERYWVSDMPKSVSRPVVGSAGQRGLKLRVGLGLCRGLTLGLIMSLASRNLPFQSIVF